MKKLISILLILCLSLAMAACGSAPAQKAEPTPAPETEAPAPTPEAEAEAQEPEAPVERTEEEMVNVTFDFNYDGAPEPVVIQSPKGKVIQPYDGASEHTAPANPEREGYRFVGWDASPDPVLENGYSTTVWPLGDYFLPYYAAYGDMDSGDDKDQRPQSDVTLYARWVAPTEIATADELDAMRNDLAGWYVLTADIDLSGRSWVPVGIYRTTYEWMQQPWWAEAFQGKLDGNGHTIKGLTLDRTDYYDVSLDPENATRNSCSALIGGAANGAEICDLTLADVSIDVKSSQYASYVAPLIAFNEGCDVRDCHVTGLDFRFQADDENEGNGMYVSLGGLMAGVWFGETVNCSVEGTITADLTNRNTHTGDTFIGGLIGDGYQPIDSCQADVDITVNYVDECAETYEKPENEAPDNGILLVYAFDWQKLIVGGLAGQSGGITNSSSKGNITLNISSPVENVITRCDPLCYVFVGDEIVNENAEGTGNLVINK